MRNDPNNCLAGQSAVAVLGIISAFFFASCYPVKVIIVDADKPLKVQVINSVSIDTTGAIPVRVTNSEPPRPPHVLQTCEVGRAGRFNPGAAHPCVNGPCTIVNLAGEVSVMEYRDGSDGRASGDFFVKKIGPFNEFHYPLQKNEFLSTESEAKVHCEFYVN